MSELGSIDTLSLAINLGPRQRPFVHSALSRG
jgi:hypothetical protein